MQKRTLVSEKAHPHAFGVTKRYDIRDSRERQRDIFARHRRVEGMAIATPAHFL
jgi:hypothetical protein